MPNKHKKRSQDFRGPQGAVISSRTQVTVLADHATVEREAPIMMREQEVETWVTPEPLPFTPHFGRRANRESRTRPR